MLEQNNLLVKQFSENQGITEKFTAENQMLWVQMINSILKQVRVLLLTCK
ncbi:MAG: TnpV protein [Eubacterium sp.]